MTDTEKEPTVARWIGEIDRYEKRAEKWRQKCEKIIRRYSDERRGNAEDAASRFNSLWANVQAMQPSLYIKLPKPEVERRYLDSDKTGRVASEVLQRAITFLLNNEVHQTFRQNILDYLLVGIGTTWIRYVPHFTGGQTEAEEELAEDGLQIEQDAEDESITWEEVAVDYVHYRDFGHTEARVWSEVNAVWRRAFLTREELKERFPDHEEIPLNFGVEERHSYDHSNLIGDDANVKKAIIYEIWDKEEGKAIWINKDYPKVLDEKDDPLGLEHFFPCPMPLYATRNNNSLIPIPDYVLYQDQAIELDEICQRVAMLNKSIKVAGVYDKNCDGVQRILNEGVENQLVPVDSWAIFAERGGLQGAIDLLPIADIVKARNELEVAFERTKARMDEITGMVDIRRGNTNASETATAQQLKSNYSNIRLRDRQAEVQRFIRDNVELIGEVVASLFQTETLKAITGLKLLDSQIQKQQLIQQIQASGQPEIPEEIELMMDAPTWEEVVGMLRDKATRNFRIDIETDSTVMADEQAEKQDRMELLAGLTNAMEKLVPIAQANPMLAPLIGEMVLFGVRSFRVGRPFESRIEEIITKMEKAAQNPAPAQPSPEQVKAQAEQAKIQAEMAKIQMASQQEATRMQAEAMSQKSSQDHDKDMVMAESMMAKQQAQLDAQVEQIKQQAQAEHTRMTNELENQRALMQAQIDADMKRMDNEYKLMFEQMKQSKQEEEDDLR